MVQSWINEQMPAQNELKAKPQEMVGVQFVSDHFGFVYLTFFMFCMWNESTPWNTLHSTDLWVVAAGVVGPITRHIKG